MRIRRTPRWDISPKAMERIPEIAERLDISEERALRIARAMLKPMSAYLAELGVGKSHGGVGWAPALRNPGPVSPIEPRPDHYKFR